MIRITVFNEFFHEKKDPAVREIYPDGIHKTLKENLSDDEITVQTVTLDNVNDITDELLKNTDVLIWWGHMKQGDVPDEVAKRVQNAVLSGMGAIFLHSAHHSKPFKLLMGTPCSLSWREDGDREYLWAVDPSHPIAEGVDRFVRLDHEETYSEPFSIPEPDKLIFIGSFEGGEVLRAGCCYRRGYGKIFYFQPGHETYPIYHNPQIIRIIKNAAHWAYSGYRKEIDCPKIKKIGE